MPKPDPMHRVVVAAMIQDDHGRLLAMQRPEGKWGAGKWEFPGGKLETGEDPKAAILRECREEMDITIQPGKVFNVVCHRYSDEMPSIVLIFYLATIVSGVPRPVEGGALLWLSQSELDSVDWLEADLPILHKWKADQPAESV